MCNNTYLIDSAKINTADKRLLSSNEEVQSFLETLNILQPYMHLGADINATKWEVGKCFETGDSDCITTSSWYKVENGKVILWDFNYERWFALLYTSPDGSCWNYAINCSNKPEYHSRKIADRLNLLTKDEREKLCEKNIIFFLSSIIYGGVSKTQFYSEFPQPEFVKKVDEDSSQLQERLIELIKKDVQIKEKVLEYITRDAIYKSLVNANCAVYNSNPMGWVPKDFECCMSNVALSLAKKNTLTIGTILLHDVVDENGSKIFESSDNQLLYYGEDQLLTPLGFPNGMKLDEYKKLNISKNDHRSNTASVYHYVESHDYETSFAISFIFDRHASALWPYSASSGNPPNSMGYANLDYLNTWHGKHVESGCLGCEVFGKSKFFC